MHETLDSSNFLERYTAPMSKRDGSDNIEVIAARLKSAREAFGMSQKEFAAKADISNTTYNNWEASHSPIGISGALKLRKEYGLSLDWIYCGDADNLSTKASKALGLISLVSDSSKSKDSPVS